MLQDPIAGTVSSFEAQAAVVDDADEEPLGTESEPGRTALIISARFPPLFNIGGKRAYRFARYLPRFGWRPVVWTGPVPPRSVTDPTPVRLDRIRVVRTYQPGWWPQSDVRYMTATSPLQRPWTQPGRLRRLLALPGGKDLLLTPRAAVFLHRLCRRERVGVLLASSGPPAALVHAWVASRLTGIPFCVDMRDPWSLNFLQRSKASWVRTAEARIERMLFRRAARVIFTCTDAANAYRELYPELPLGRIVTIPNSFDPIFRPAVSMRVGPVVLAHFGHCNGPRTLATILLALAELRRGGGWPEEGLQLLNLGRVHEEDLRLAATLGLTEVFQHRGPLPYQQGLQFLARTDLLILLGYGEERLYVPAKTFDYLLAGSPVLCLAPDCEMSRLIEKAGAGRAIAPGDVAGAEVIIRAAIAHRKGGPPLSVPDPESIRRYDARQTAAALAAVLDEAVGEPAALPAV